MGRSFHASSLGAKRALKALDAKGWTKKYLSDCTQCSRPTLHKFFKGESVDKEIFQNICSALELEWKEIAELPAYTEDTVDTVDSLVETVRQKIHDDIEYLCGAIRVLEMTHPVKLEAIYTTVNIQEEYKDFELKRFTHQRLPALQLVDMHSRLMLLGKPGSGKTTFLKRLATLCNEGRYQSQYVPTFITIKHWAEEKGKPDLLNYITQQWKCDISCKTETVSTIVSQGRALILMDGLDEVRSEDRSRVLQEIRDFAITFRSCQLVITCRTAAQEYTFEQFTEVEIADFDNGQIADFAHKWFAVEKRSNRADNFLQKLIENPRIMELANNPLLLTLLCLVFNEANDFPLRRSDLYEEGCSVLLKRWDAKRNIERDQVYRTLSHSRKRKLLSYIAFQTFANDEDVYRKKTIEKHIENYMRTLSGASEDSEALQLDSEAILKSIVAQHGLLTPRLCGMYSFSHLTFQEFLTAQKIVDSSTDLEKSLQELVSHITQKRWREVFLLTAEMLDSADMLIWLMKTQIDSILSKYKKIQEFLIHLNEKEVSVETPYNSTAVRAFYFALAFPLGQALYRDFELMHSLDKGLYERLNQARDLDRNYALTSDLACFIRIDGNIEYNSDHISDFILEFDLIRTLDRAHTLDCDSSRTAVLTRDLDVLIRDSELELQESLQRLKEQLPVSTNNQDLKLWWRTNGSAWANGLRSLIKENRGIGYNWQFSDEETEKLQQYYDATRLLVDCLNSNSYITQSVGEEVKSSLLLPNEERN